MQYKSFWYSFDDGVTRYCLRVHAGSTESDCAVAAGEDYHTNHDGWEARWPKVVRLFSTEDGPEVARFEIERDTMPVFYASKA